MNEESLHKDLVYEKFFKGDVVFKIMVVSEDDVTRDIGMVNTKEDYEKKLYSHMYQPFLFIIELGLRLAYLYGCLNRQFKNPHNEEYIFMWREIRTNEWYQWFKVKPYHDNVYQEVPIIEYFC